jgi:hypothetical protein
MKLQDHITDARNCLATIFETANPDLRKSAAIWLTRIAQQILDECDEPPATEPATDDPPMKVVPIPREMRPLPPAPEGFKWVGRGNFGDDPIPAHDQKVMYWDGARWMMTEEFSVDFFHIELIKKP